MSFSLGLALKCRRKSQLFLAGYLLGNLLDYGGLRMKGLPQQDQEGNSADEVTRS